jgi:glycosyltransferase involved in cell wall biosynthesis
MPVFNGEKYLCESIESIMNQTYTDFELIISDNASKDRTQEICTKYAAQDNRISYYRNPKNLGAPNNYNRVFALSSGELFKWAAYDDVIAPEFLRKCVKVLDNDSSIILCHSKSGKIDQDGNLIDYYNKGMLKKIDSPRPHERFWDLINMYYTTCPIFGVFRTNLLSKTFRHGNYIGADRNLLAEVGLLGRIYQIPECLFFWRDHPASYTSTFYRSNQIPILDRLQMETSWWAKKISTSFTHWKNCMEYIKSVNKVSLKWFEKLLCYAQIFKWFMKQGWYFMGTDIELFLLRNSSFARRVIPFLASNLKLSSFIDYKKMRY